ncbi:maintenance of mitochondrial morphology protein 1 [Gymnopilus junonius]|uniref:Maintenance of mitochondrial morphology protein 1 n=1 Tax=Gymnopilus junonius TaxID=109634 RepID=A0A9P5TT55_GYMJU|nr:maintenance of mitochondrial morphology protein 1 [Gymnopilus junonius]
MSGCFPLSFQPTFAQGLFLGHLTFFFMACLVVRYLFLESSKDPFRCHHQVDNDPLLRQPNLQSRKNMPSYDPETSESTEWFNTLLRQIVDVYRSKLRDDVEGIEGDEIARKRIENYANSIRPVGFVDHITIHSVNLGVSAPSLFSARVRPSQEASPTELEFDASYTDTISLSLSTSYLFNYPTASFARLPISLTISLSQFKSSISVRPPSPTSVAPVLTLTISPNFVLDLTTTSLMGSRAKLANVPKLHELIQHQVRRVLAARATWKIVLPGLATIPVAEQAL